METKLPQVTFEQAKQLKELGFNYGCEEVYDATTIKNPTGTILWDVEKFHYENDVENIYAVPTLALAMMWIRDNHNIYIRPFRQWLNGERDNVFGFEYDNANNKDHYLNFKDWEAAESRGITLALNEITNRN